MTEPPARPGWKTRWREWQQLPLNFIILSVLVGVGIVQLSFQIGLMAYRTVTWTRETHEAQGRIAGLERDVRVLQDAKVAAQSPEYLETLARCQGFVGAGEQVLVADSAPDNAPENCRVLRLP